MDEVILVDERGAAIGSAPTTAAHDAPHLHRAFSVFLFDDRGRTLLQRRAAAKQRFGGLWSNTCCSHPRPGETVAVAAARRLGEEFGIAADLEEVGSFVYFAVDPVSGLTEHEFDHVLVGYWSGVPQPDPREIAEWRWADAADVDRLLDDDGAGATPWLAMAWEIAAQAPDRVG